MNKIILLSLLFLTGCGSPIHLEPQKRQCFEEKTRFICVEYGEYIIYEVTSKGF